MADFMRAPGAPGKPAMPPSQSPNPPNLTPLLPGSSNSTWSLNRQSEGGWPESNSGNGNGGNADGVKPNVDNIGNPMDSNWPPSSQQNVAGGSYGLDIKPFEPGKPWMMKNIEDDPTVTPGSVTRSPLSLGIKDSELLSSISKTSTTNTVTDITGPLTSLSLSSNTWSFNPGSGPGQPGTSNSPLAGFGNPRDSKLNSVSAGKGGPGSWGESGGNGGAGNGGGGNSGSNLASELWGAPGGNSKLRGPPPGMSAGGPGAAQGGAANKLGAAAGTWGGLGRSTSWTGEPRNPTNSALHPATSLSGGAWTNSQMPSTWLILKNLTPQIDGSTLKTLCMQHGPLINFHLSLNHGFALVNYGSREEAVKAQGNLNNCLLSNTTILAEFASDSEVKQVMGQLSHQNQGAPPTPGPGGNGAGSWGGSGRGSTPTSQSGGGSKVDSWGGSSGSNLWSSGPSSASSLWGSGGLADGVEQHRATPSNLKPYLPDGLLTSESM